MTLTACLPRSGFVQQIVAPDIFPLSLQNAGELKRYAFFYKQKRISKE